MQKSFIFLIIIWNTSPFSPGNTATTNVLEYPLGCRAVIPCQLHRSDASTAEWFYRKQGHSNRERILFQDKTGVITTKQHFRTKILLLENNYSLVIVSLTEEEQGLYWCEICVQNKCVSEQQTVVSIKKEIETQETFFIRAGHNFTHACPSEFTNLKWTFEASEVTADGSPVQNRLSYLNPLTLNKSLRIFDVKLENAGKYTCWTHGCNEYWKKLLTINLCVIIVHRNEDSSVSCAVMCDMESRNIKPNGTFNMRAGTWTISVLVGRNGSLICTTMPTSGGTTSTKGPAYALNSTSVSTGTEPMLIPVISATLTALTCLLLMAILIYYLRSRLRGVFPVQLCCCGLNNKEEEETQVTYSSIVIRRSADIRSALTTNNDCVYSEINVEFKNEDVPAKTIPTLT
nr:uncharacterized protein LOC109999130 [Labrus bergylta]